MTLLEYALIYLGIIALIVIVDYGVLKALDLDGFKAPYYVSLFLTTLFFAVIIGIWQSLGTYNYFWMFFLPSAVFLGPLLSYTATTLYQAFRKRA